MGHPYLITEGWSLAMNHTLLIGQTSMFDNLPTVKSVGGILGFQFKIKVFGSKLNSRTLFYFAGLKTRS